MTLVRLIARPLLAAPFIAAGVNSIRTPIDKLGPAEKLAHLVHQQVPLIPDDPRLVIRANGALNVLGGLMLASGKFPRVSSAVLAVSLVPQTAYGHDFWRTEDGDARAAQRAHFVKSLGLLGGLLLAAVDTAGKPGLAWRAKNAASVLASSGERLVHDANRETKLLAAKAQLKAHELTP